MDKIELTEKQTQWLVRHFKHTKNADIAARLGICVRTLNRVAKKLGLEKTPQFMRKCRAENRIKAVAAIAAEPPEKRQQRREQVLRSGMKSRFKKGENRIWQLSAERQAEIQRKRAETWKKTRAMEISRVSLGLEQKTNFRLPKEFDQDKNKVLISRRYILRAKGYVIKRGSMAVYITPETVRSEEMERSAAKIGFVFRQV